MAWCPSSQAASFSPLILLWGLSAFNSYVNALQAATQAYDRTLLSSARTVSERLVV
ncbi:sensor histidine kinase N-terminal domain-containing protein, partial [Salmonella enterica subsp. enterica serovar Montevideo]|nr:sensor histidine kinase N-terminal domain-containing protein [Salmonella enterica subsp. enterica serovar Montevideo]